MANVSWQNGDLTVSPAWEVKAVGDFDGDGYTDIVWRLEGGQVAIWLMVGSVYRFEVFPDGGNFGVGWQIQGAGDFDADGHSDLLWRHDDGRLAIWFKGSEVGAAYPSWRNLGTPPDLRRQVQGVSDFNADGRSDILWRRSDGAFSIWTMEGGTWTGEVPPALLESAWQTKGLLPVW